jgi:replicative DNA helicase
VLQAVEKLARAPIFVDDSSDMSVLELRAKSRRLAARHGLGLVVVDYLQLMRPEGRPDSSRVEQIGQISRGLKILARELNVPVIAVSQLSRAVESRNPPVPMLSDLRESGCLSGDSRVYLPESGEYKPIAELVGRSGFDVVALNTETWKLERRKVTQAFVTGHKPVYRLTTQLGRTIRATGNHKFLAFDGWKRLDELTPGEPLAVPGMLAVDSLMPQKELAVAMATSSTPLLLPAPEYAIEATGDAEWDTAMSIEPDGVEEVYDLTVEGLHNFVAEDIVVHNSIEQDADLVMFIYRDEYYNKESERLGEADVIVAKHRNGPIGEVALTFLPKYPKFANLYRDRGAEPTVPVDGDGAF